MKIEIYSDIVCPWCYIGERRLARALAALPNGQDVDVVFRPYQLDPGAPTTAIPLLPYLEQRFGSRAAGMMSHVTATAAGEGITTAWDKALSVNTRLAHRVVAFAEREYGAGVQRALVERLFALYFTQGGNVGDVDQLVAAAADVGVDPDRVRVLLASDDGVAELEAAFESARRLGIQSVPTFVIDGRHAVVGAQPAAALLEVLENLARASEPENGTGDRDSCEDGRCSTDSPAAKEAV